MAVTTLSKSHQVSMMTPSATSVGKNSHTVKNADLYDKVHVGNSRNDLEAKRSLPKLTKKTLIPNLI